MPYFYPKYYPELPLHCTLYVLMLLAYAGSLFYPNLLPVAMTLQLIVGSVQVLWALFHVLPGSYAHSQYLLTVLISSLLVILGFWGIEKMGWSATVRDVYTIVTVFILPNILAALYLNMVRVYYKPPELMCMSSPEDLPNDSIEN